MGGSPSKLCVSFAAVSYDWDPSKVGLMIVAGGGDDVHGGNLINQSKLGSFIVCFQVAFIWVGFARNWESISARTVRSQQDYVVIGGAKRSANSLVATVMQ